MSKLSDKNSLRWLATGSSDELPKAALHLYETKCRCGCNKNNMSQKFIDKIYRAQMCFDYRITIGQQSSGYRCPKRNAKVGGSQSSKHKPDMFGNANAGDLSVINAKAGDTMKLFLLLMALNPSDCGIGWYPNRNFIHFDCRTWKKRWINIGGKYHYFNTNTAAANAVIKYLEEAKL